MTLTPEHEQELAQAKARLENPSIAAKISGVAARPIEKGVELLPESAKAQILEIARTSLESALKAALYTLSDEPAERSKLAHMAGGALSGALGGSAGLAGLAIELPLSTTIMLRSIADTARAEGEDLKSRETQLACLEVFALGSPSATDDAADAGYFAVRAALASAVSDATAYAVSTGAIRDSAPTLVRFIGKVATRFSIPVTEKAAAQAVPLVGAAGGAIINALFIDHFQDMAHGHFVVRRLERTYDPTLVRAAYEAM